MGGEEDVDALFWMATGRFSDTGRFGTVEVFRFDDEAGPKADPVYMVLCSESATPDGDLECRIGFSNDASWCDRMTGRGFPFVEGWITLGKDRLEVRSAAFHPGDENRAAPRELDYDSLVLMVDGVRLEAPGEEAAGDSREYRQDLQTLDPAQPASHMRTSAVTWRFAREAVSLPAAGVAMTFEPLRWPPTLPAGRLEASKVLAGRAVIPEDWSARDWRQERVGRPEQYGPSESSFRKIEVLGVRLTVPPEDEIGMGSGEDPVTRQQRKLYRLISPLNFHLRKGSAANDSKRPDFHYRPATDALTLELLRYGRMTIGKAFGDVTTDDFESQHELLVRLVVGRVDEDSAQAQEVATFVPVLFVDNTWSKFLGRQFMGLDKRLAHFCTLDSDGPAPLSPRDAAGLESTDPEPHPPPPLASIAELRLANRVLPEGRDPGAQAKRRELAGQAPLLLQVQCEPALIADWDNFDLAPTDAVLRRSPIAPRRWRQEDFEDAEVRRDFARAAGTGSTGSFLGIQSAPVGDERMVKSWKDAQTWITGRYAIAGSAMLARPRGTVTVTLHRLADRYDVKGWDRLCDLLNVPTETGERFKVFSLPPGSWYRLLYDMDLSLENGLE